MNRAGKFIRQPAGYYSFVPASLKPGMIAWDPELQRLLGEADRALGRLEGTGHIVPDADQFVAAYSRKEALLSSQIEGSKVSMVDVLTAEVRDEEDREISSDVQEVINHGRALRYGVKRLARLPLSNRLLAEVHSVLMSGSRGVVRLLAEFRTRPHWIGPPECSIEEADFVPPLPAEMEQAVSDFEEYLSEDTETPILIKCGLAHYQFESIHPFESGNGRMGRLLVTLMLHERQVLTRPLLYISVFLQQHRSEYYDLLSRVRSEDDFEEWLKFFLRGVTEVATEASETVGSILQMREEHLALVREEVQSRRAPALVEFLLSAPALSVNKAAHGLGVTYATANDLIRELERLGLVEQITGGSRNRVFLYSEYLNLLGGAWQASVG